MLYIPILVSLFAIGFTFFLIKEIKEKNPAPGKSIAISKSIQEGAAAFLRRQYKVMFSIALVLFFLLWIFLGFKTGIGFLTGAVFSALSGLIGMLISTRTSLRVVEAAKRGKIAALKLAFSGGSITGLLVASLALLAISAFYLLTQDLKALVALGFGGSLVSVFARLGGGIYTKAADIGADLVGKVEEEIPEDDPRNPAVIADQVGDNVGDCAGMAADIFETYVVTLVAVMLLGSFINETAIILPLYLGTVALLASIIAVFVVRISKSKKVVFALFKPLIVSIVLSGIGFFGVIRNFSSSLKLSFFSLYLSSLAGLIIGGGMFLITNYYTSSKYKPVRAIASASEQGHAPNIITGLALGMKSCAWPLILICLGILVSFGLGGIYGLGIAVISMVSLAGIIVALDAYGPITDNASGIAEMSDLPKKIREVTDSLDAVGNTTKATTKAYAIASAALAALVLFSAYTQEIQEGIKVSFYLSDYKVLIGLLVGGLLPYLFSSFAMEAVGKTGSKVVQEVRKQFKEISGLREGKAKPDYKRCVDIVTKASLKEMIIPALIPVIFPVLIGFLLGVEALGGLLIGSIITGFFVAISMTSGGAAWDNAKKFIEEGHLGGKGSFAHKSAVTGDTVGDPYKDTAGPAINPMIKVLNVVALLIVSFL